VQHFQSLGFKSVTIDLEGFRSGSMNATLPLAAISNLKSQISNLISNLKT
jgi:hypothetical protein